MSIFASSVMVTDHLRIVSFSFHKISLDRIGKLHIPEEEKSRRTYALMRHTAMSECMILATCNRVEIITSLPHFLCPGLPARILEALYPEMSADDRNEFIKAALIFNGADALRHLFLLAAGLDSKIIGEREISGQIRKTYDEYNELGSTGDLLRLVVSHAVRVAKDVFTQTPLGTGSVSISSLCWQKLREHGMNEEQNIVFLGAGEVISSLAKFFHEAGFANLIFVNRTSERAIALSREFGGVAIALDEFWTCQHKMNILISCTGSTELIVTNDRFGHFVHQGIAPQLLVDLANPADIEEVIGKENGIRLIRLGEIQEAAEKNLQHRRDMIDQCIPIIESHERELHDDLKVRRVEIAMSAIPESVKDIRKQAVEQIFAKEINDLDDDSRELMLRMLDYMERKYISIPMKLAKEVLLTNIDAN
ncbi:MAG: glutamyl-tRNA reductase [Flavobacteriales bacterium]